MDWRCGVTGNAAISQLQGPRFNPVCVEFCIFSTLSMQVSSQTHPLVFIPKHEWVCKSMSMVPCDRPAWSRVRLQTHYNPEQVKTITEYEQINNYMYMLQFLGAFKSVTNMLFPYFNFYWLGINQITQVDWNKSRQTDGAGSFIFSLSCHLKLRVSEMQLNTEFKKKKRRKLPNKSAKIYNLKSNCLELSRYNNSLNTKIERIFCNIIGERDNSLLVWFLQMVRQQHSNVQCPRKYIF